MFCPACGTKNDDNAFRCIECNVIIQPIAKPVAAAEDPTLRMILPVGTTITAIAAGLQDYLLFYYVLHLLPSFWVY